MSNNPFQKPDRETFLARYVEECEKQRVPTSHDYQREAESCLGWLDRHNWRDKTKRKIVSWERFIESSVDRLKRRKSNYTAPKVMLPIADCCWRPLEKCDCTLLVFDNDNQYTFPQDMLKAMDSITDNEKCAFDALMTMRRIYEIPIAQYADKNYIESSCTDLARNYLEEADQHEYFCRMGWWIEFIVFLPGTHFDIEAEMLKAYQDWLSENGRKRMLKNDYPDRYAMARGQLEEYRAGRLTPAIVLGIPEEEL